MIEMFFPVFLSEFVGANATKDESKDPEDPSSAMLPQGISPKLLLALHMHGYKMI